jgi:hypothetical protein
MVTGKTYEEIRSLGEEELGLGWRGLYCTEVEDLRAMLSEYGYSLSRWTPFKSYAPINSLSILGIERSSSGVDDHWVVLVKCGLDMYVLDPSPRVKTVKRRDWGRLRTVSYMNIFLI